MSSFAKKIAVVVALGLTGALLGASKSRADIPPTAPSITYSFPQVISGLNRPIFVTHAGDDRLFIVEQTGKIKIFQNGAVLPTAFLDTAGKSSSLGSSGSERGLLGLAFEPGYAQALTPTFYVYYTAVSGGDITIARYTTFLTDTNVADPLSAQVILTIEHGTYGNHNGGWIGFGPDNLLYAGVGDGGSSGDPFCASEMITNTLGKILRLDVIGQVTYTTPASNIFSPTQSPEIVALGLRNPWRNSFDRLTGDLYIGDVGQGQWEEVNYVVSGTLTGKDFGWSQFEGFAPYSRSPAACVPSGIAPTSPFTAYLHTSGNNSVTGGYVYRGASQPWLNGAYYYADFVSGRIWTAWQTAPGVFANGLISNTAYNISSFGEDNVGEIYVVDYGRSPGGTYLADSGAVYRLSSRLAHMVFLPNVARDFAQDY